MLGFGPIAIRLYSAEDGGEPTWRAVWDFKCWSCDRDIEGKIDLPFGWMITSIRVEGITCKRCGNVHEVFGKVIEDERRLRMGDDRMFIEVPETVKDEIRLCSERTKLPLKEVKELVAEKVFREFIGHPMLVRDVVKRRLVGELFDTPNWTDEKGEPDSEKEEQPGAEEADTDIFPIQVG